MKLTSNIIFLLGFLTLLFSCEKSFEPISNADYKVVFVSSPNWTTGNIDIWTMDSNGKNRTNLTNNPGNYFFPKYSPNGSQIMFIKSNNLYIMNEDGSDLKQLTNSNLNSEIYNYSFSQDGRYIVFEYKETSTHYNDGIYILNLENESINQIINTSAYASPVFSPDGQQIIYRESVSNELYIIDIDGSNRTRLFEHLNQDMSVPLFSPDGSTICYAATDNDSISIFKMDANGNNSTRLISNLSWLRLIQFSPDSRNLLYSTSISDLHLININSGTIKIVYDDKYAIGDTPMFSFDGLKIMFYDRYLQVYIIDIDGENFTNISKNNLEDYHPYFRPN